MTELTFVVYPKSGERGMHVRGLMLGWTDQQIVDCIRSACRRQAWTSSEVHVYRQTSGGWTEPWGEVDLATGDYRRRSR